ncbi:hypothetical protein RSAG8_08660, partial [Rhizoctonia solani AG-8 WAC10335]
MANRPSPSPPPDSPPSSPPSSPPPFAYSHRLKPFVSITSPPMIHVGRPAPLAPPNFSALHSHYTPRSSQFIAGSDKYSTTFSRLQTTTVSPPPFAYSHRLKPFVSITSPPMIHIISIHRRLRQVLDYFLSPPDDNGQQPSNRHATPPESMRASDHDRGLKRARSEDVEEEEERQESVSSSEASEHAEQPIMPAPKKRTRTLMTPDQLTALHRLLSQTRFPTTEQREQCGREIGLSARRVQVWFQNQRQKSKAQQQANSTAGGSRQASASKEPTYIWSC